MCTDECSQPSANSRLQHFDKPPGLDVGEFLKLLQVIAPDTSGDAETPSPPSNRIRLKPMRSIRLLCISVGENEIPDSA